MKRIVILGGGFAGVSVLMELEKRLPADQAVEITLVSKENFLLFTPMLHEIAASDIDITHIVNPLRKLARRGRFFIGTVEAVDMEGRRVRVSHGAGHHHSLEYDHLVLALGATTNFYGIPGLDERAMTMKSLGDAIHLRNRLIRSLEQADFECAKDDRAALLTFVVAGAGFAGVETVAAINDFVREASRFYRNLSEDDIRIVLVHAGSVILPELDEKLGRYAQERLAGRGVEIRLETRVTAATPEGVDLSDGGHIVTRNVVWTAGTAVNPLVAGLPCAGRGGRAPVDAFLRVTDWPDVWALGDCASVPDGRGGFHPPTAQHAVRQGVIAARNIAATLGGGTLRPFEFSTLGQLAAIGRRTGVASVFGFNFSGFIAWWLWRTIYLAKLPRFEKKVRVALDWTLDLLFSKDLVEFDTGRTAVDTHAAHEDPEPSRRRPALEPPTRTEAEATFATAPRG